MQVNTLNTLRQEFEEQQRELQIEQAHINELNNQQEQIRTTAENLEQETRTLMENSRRQREQLTILRAERMRLSQLNGQITNQQQAQSVLQPNVQITNQQQAQTMLQPNCQITTQQLYQPKLHLNGQSTIQTRPPIFQPTYQSTFSQQTSNPQPIFQSSGPSTIQRSLPDIYEERYQPRNENHKIMTPEHFNSSAEKKKMT